MSKISHRRRRNLKAAVNQSDDDINQVIEKIDNMRIKTRKRDQGVLKTKTKPLNKIYGSIAAIILIFSISGIFFGKTITNVNHQDDSVTDLSGEYIFQDLSQRSFDLYQFSGKHIVLDYMGTQCIPCKQQVEILKEFVIDYPDVIVVSFSTESPEVLSDFVIKNNISWIVLFDKYHMSIELGITHMPTLVHFGPEFIEIHRNIGVTSYNILSSWVK